MRYDGVLLCSDFDGTLAVDSKVSKENLDAIKEIIGDSHWEQLPYNKMAGAKYKMLGMSYEL